MRAAAGGWRDFRRKPMMGLFFANVCRGHGRLADLRACSCVIEQEWWAIPLTVGFPLLGPFLAVGLYEVSRRLEAGQTEWRRNDIFGVIWRQRARQLPLHVLGDHRLFPVLVVLRAYAVRAVSRALGADERHLVLCLSAGARGSEDAAGRNGFGAVFAFVLFCLTVGVAAAAAGQGTGFRHRDADLDRGGAEEPGGHGPGRR
jgi:hypothetical protein